MKKIPMLEKFAAQSLVEHDGELIFSKEKFAELIVREFIQEMETSKRCDPYTGELFVSEYNRTIDEQISMVKEHFGVEDPPLNDVDRILRTVRTRN